MTDSFETTPAHEADSAAGAVPAAVPQYPTYGAPPVGGQVAAYAGTHAGPAGRIRGTGVCILLMIITLGFYSLYWFYATHSEMKRHSGQGIGGGIALILAIFIGFVSPFIVSSEVGGLYERTGMRKPVSGATGLWYLPGMFIVIGPLVWFIKTNGALNSYWRLHGAS